MTKSSTGRPVPAKKVQLNKVTLKDLTPTRKDTAVKGGLSIGPLPPPRGTFGC